MRVGYKLRCAAAVFSVWVGGDTDILFYSISSSCSTYVHEGLLGEVGHPHGSVLVIEAAIGHTADRPRQLARSPLVVEVGVGGEGGLGPAGLHVRGRVEAEVVDGVGPALVPGEARVDLAVVVGGGAVGAVLVGVYEPGHGVDALLVGPRAGPSTRALHVVAVPTGAVRGPVQGLRGPPTEIIKPF